MQKEKHTGKDGQINRGLCDCNTRSETCVMGGLVRMRTKTRLKTEFNGLNLAKNMNSFQVQVAYLPRQTSPWLRKQISINLKQMKSYRMYSSVTVELNQKSITEEDRRSPGARKPNTMFQTILRSKRKSLGNKRNSEPNENTLN